MSENRRNRRNRGRNHGKFTEDEPPIQPKILLKTKEKDKTGVDNSTTTAAGVSSAAATGSVSVKASQISIATRESNSATDQQQPISSSPSVGNGVGQPKETAGDPAIIVKPVPQMTHPVALTPATMHHASKNLIPSNTDFVVVGVIGRQGVGKSTIMNWLAAENADKDLPEEEVFSTQMKSGKTASSPRTETMLMFITKDRLILLDAPPIMMNQTKKDDTADIENIIAFLTTCHLLIVIQDDYFDINMLKRLQFAELCKENTNSALASDYFPSVLFVKNKAKRNDFLAKEKTRMNKMLHYFFRQSQLQVLYGQKSHPKKSKSMDSDATVNYVVFPDVNDPGNDLYSLEVIVKDLRNRVFSTSKYPMTTTSDLNEIQWFEILSNLNSANQHNFFLKMYSMRLVGGGGGGGGGVANELYE